MGLEAVREVQPEPVEASRRTPLLARPYTLEPDAVASALGVDPAIGLTRVEAELRLRVDGPNELEAAPPVPWWRILLQQFQDPLIYLLLVAVLISLAAWLLEGAEGLPVDVLVIVAIVLLNAVLGYVQEARAAHAVEVLMRMTEATCTVLRDGEPCGVPAREVVRGDVLLLGEGDAVGADARLIEASALRVAEAALTGESAAVRKQATALVTDAPSTDVAGTAEVALADRLNMVHKGTAVAQGVGRALVTATGMDTEVGAIAEMLETTVEEPTPLQREITEVSKVLGLLVVVVAVVVMVTMVLIGGVRESEQLLQVLLLGVSLAVAAVPEGLPAVLSVVLAIGVRRMAERNAVVKKLDSVESLGSASVICTDKTGTLTRNEMTLQRVVTHAGTAELTGVGYRPEGHLETGQGDTDPSQRHEVELLLAAGSLANNAHLSQVEGEWCVQGDPTEAAFLVAAAKVPGATELMGRFQPRAQIPFTSERKLMSALVLDSGALDSAALDTAATGETGAEEASTHVLLCKGAPDVLLARCVRQQTGDRTVPLSEAAREAVLEEIEQLSGEAFRTLGVGYRLVPEFELDGSADEVDERLEQGLVYVGTVGIIDPPRVEAARAIAEARRAGIRVVMITGDHPSTAARIAADLGLVGPGERAVSGTELDRLDEPGLRQVARDHSVFARTSPQHKLRLVDALQADGHVVAMTGDGVNDAPALKSADIGVAMGITGTEVTKEAARMVLADDNFATIVAAVRQGRVIFDNIKKFLRYLLSSNLGEVLTVFLGVMLAGVIGLGDATAGTVVVPLLATQILWINLVTDSTPALAMGVDPEIDDVMARRPRPLADRIIDRAMWGQILSVGLVMALATLAALDLSLPGGLIPGEESLEVARTAAFTTLVLAQLFNAINARSAEASAFRGLFRNGWLWAALALGALLQVAVVHVSWLQVAFDTAALRPSQWATCVLLASVVLWFSEARKLARAALRRRRAVASGEVEVLHAR